MPRKSKRSAATGRKNFFRARDPHVENLSNIDHGDSDRAT
jgi:hypothetical protein